MSRDKKHRHDASHDHHERERPASTDLADVVGDEAAKAASEHDRKKPGAGPSEDDRFGEGPVATNAEGRIIKVDIVGGRTRIGIGLGSNQGVHVGMEGYVKSDDGMLADFQIEAVKERVAYAFVETTLDALRDHSSVVVNPSSMPKATQVKQDMHARIVGLSVEGGMTKILIGLGTRHGARAGMHGYLVGGKGGAFDTFEIVEQHPGHCVAYVKHTLDTVRQHTDVVVNPAVMPG